MQKKYERSFMAIFKNIFPAKIIRISGIVLVSLSCLISYLWAQDIPIQNIKETKITIQATNLPIRQIFDNIEKQTSFIIGYDNVLDVNKKVSLNLKNTSVYDILNKLLQGYKGTVSQVDNTHVLLKIEKISKPIPKQKVDGQQQRILTGKVFDESGNGLPGVTVKVQGSSRGAVTDPEGKYTLQINSSEEIIKFSFIGYISQEKDAGDLSTLDIKLTPNPDTELEEVAVVAYGQQKKGSVVGSVTTVRPGDLKIPSSNLTTALAGRIAGIIAYQRSGEPGADNADFFVRGITTFGTNNKPLILIDGIELTSTDLARLQPDDIASFSILKDASATALYGARGANGVILVTTKEGAVGRANISVRLENSISAPTSNVKLADPITYMKLHNEAILTRDPLGLLPYSEDKIANTEAGLNNLVYPANDWKSMLLKDYTTTRRANLNASGGGSVARYYVAGSYNQDNGILKVDKRNNFNNNIDLKNYSLRANVNIDITPITELIVRLSGNFDDYSGPLDGGTGMYSKIMRSNPVLFPAYYPSDAEHSYVKHIMFGNYGENANYLNPYADMVKGYREESRSQMLAQFEVKQKLDFLTKGLNFQTMLNVTRTSNFDVSRYYDPFWYQISSYDRVDNTYQISQINDDGTEYLDYNPGTNVLNSTFYMQSILNYNRTINDKHALGGTLVFITQSSLNANAGDLQQSLPSRNMGLSGRATYGFDNRYFAEFNFGYNGSERFYKTHRYGFFPSGGVAWSVSNEKFWQPLANVISNLRFRYSYGLIGNDQIGSSSDRFFYLSNVNMNDSGKGATFGRDLNSSLNGVSISRYANNDITWETSTKQNYAMELGLFNKAKLTTEYYTEYRKHILMDRASIPNTMGLSSGIKANVGEASGKGVDMELDYQQAWSSNLWMSIRGNFTYATSKYEVYEEPEYPEKYRSRIGNSINQQYGYIAERLFVDDQEAANSPNQQFGAEYGGGDIKYLDVNKDGRVSEADMVPIGNPTVPEIVYGFGFSLSYKKFDFSAFFQGSGNQSFWIDPNATAPFVNYRSQSEINNGYLNGINLQNQLLEAYANDHWSEDNRNVYSLWPRLRASGSNGNNTQSSTWFMRNANFLRLKQVELGYTLPKSLQDKLKTSNFRIYLSGTNLLLFSKFKLWDVEMAGNGLGYPLQRVFNIGANISFN
ncbi:TonB-linked outer membrane protein, SusC/RagA family [bacterium A37T11]|nr:TonB-linked outer membrane protein, SusC/RagA family [bacterium A37T11]